MITLLILVAVFIAVAGAFVAYRLRHPHQNRLDRHRRRDGEPQQGQGGNAPGQNRHRTLPWRAIIIAVVVLIGAWGLWTLFSNGVPDAPPVATVGTFTARAWLWILLAFGAAVIIVTVFVPERVRTVSLQMLGWAGAILVFALVWSSWGSVRTPTMAGSSSPPRLQMGAYGDSVRTGANHGQEVVFGGTGFDSYCVHDGTVEKIPVGAQCSDHEPDYWFARDTSGRPNSVTFERRPRK